MALASAQMNNYTISVLDFIMSYMLPHLHNGWQVDQAILSEEDRVIVFRLVK